MPLPRVMELHNLLLGPDATEMEGIQQSLLGAPDDEEDVLALDAEENLDQKEKELRAQEQFTIIQRCRANTEKTIQRNHDIKTGKASL